MSNFRAHPELLVTLSLLRSVFSFKVNLLTRCLSGSLACRALDSPLSATMRTLGEAVWTQLQAHMLQAWAHAGQVMAPGLGISVRRGAEVGSAGSQVHYCSDQRWKVRLLESDEGREHVEGRIYAPWRSVFAGVWR